MMQSVHERLQLAREGAGYKRAVEAARAFGWATSTYIQHENGTRGLSRSKAVQYARAFRVSVGWLLNGEGRGPRGIEDKRRRRYEEVQVVGAVQAGAWREALEWHEDERYAIALPESDRFPGVPRFALRVVGDSMDRKFEDGWEVVCVRYGDLAIAPKDGDYVVIQRHDGANVEATLKRLEIRDDGTVWLRPESSNPEHLPIKLASLSTPDEPVPLAAHVSAGGVVDGQDVEIVALVDQFIGRM